MSPELILRIQQASAGLHTSSITLLAKEFIEYTERCCSPSTVPARRSRINRLVQFLNYAGISDISGLNNSVLSIYFEQLDGKPSSINAARKTIKSFINWIEQYKEIATPVRVSAIGLVKEGKQNPRYLNADVVRELINDTNIPYIDRLLIAIGFGLGFRANEISNIKLSDISGDRITTVGKGNIERVVVVPSFVLGMIETYRQLSPYPLDSYLFQSYWRGEWNKMDAKTIWRRLKPIFTNAGYPEASPHWLRHSYAVNLLVRGCDLVTIQKSLGHSSLLVTQRYLGIDDKLLAENIHKYLG